MKYLEGDPVFHTPFTSYPNNDIVPIFAMTRTSFAAFSLPLGTRKYEIYRKPALSNHLHPFISLLLEISRQHRNRKVQHTCYHELCLNIIFPRLEYLNLHSHFHSRPPLEAATTAESHVHHQNLYTKATNLPTSSLPPLYSNIPKQHKSNPPRTLTSETSAKPKHTAKQQN